MSVTLNQAAQIIERSMKDKAVSLVHLSTISQKQGCPTFLAYGLNSYCGLVLRAGYVKPIVSVVHNHVNYCDTVTVYNVQYVVYNLQMWPRPADGNPLA
jgi:hypothetical protein